VAGPTKYSSFLDSVKRRLQSRQTDAVGIRKLVEIGKNGIVGLPKLDLAQLYQLGLGVQGQGQIQKRRLKK